MITITDDALGRLERLLSESPGLCLRIQVKPGGCSGFGYEMTLEEVDGHDGLIALSENVYCAMDDFSASLLDGAEVDFIDSLMGGGFVIHNPNAVSTCSCGHSFNAEAGGEQPTPCRA